MTGNKAEVVIVGAGLVGAATAYFLARQGMKSVIVERYAIGSHASGFPMQPSAPMTKLA